MTNDMRVFSAPRTRTLHKRRGLGLLFAAGLAVAGLTAPSAMAATYGASLDSSLFQIETDANFTVDADPAVNLDWANVDEVRRGDEQTGQGDDSYKGGVKEDTECPATTTGSIPNNKSDLKNFGVYVEKGDPGYMHLFWTRVSDPSGTTLMDFEFNQSDTPCAGGINMERTTGDLLLEYAISGGGSQATITVRKWEGAAWGSAETLSASEAAGTINTSVIPADETDGTSTEPLQPRTFGEATIDLKAIFEPDKCSSFGSAMLKSRSSDAFNSQLKDYIAPVPIELTNCGKVIIRKQTEPDGATDSFGFTKAFPTDPATADGFSLSDDGVQTFENVVRGTNYTVTEDSLPTGWDLSGIDCSASTGVIPSISGATVTFDLDDITDVLDCTYTNAAKASLTVVKQSMDEAGSFQFTSSTLTPSPFQLTTTAVGEAGEASRTFSNLTPATYDVAETVPAGWNLTSATCDNGDSPDAVALTAGDDVTCTFVNAKERGAIVITKTRKHAAAEGGEGPHAGVSFTVTGANLAEPIEVVTGDNGMVCVPGLLYGDYTVTETVPENYVSDDVDKSVTVSVEADCGDARASAAGVSFVNTPLTNVTISVDSLVDGGTASTIECVDADGDPVASNTTNAPGDVSLTMQNLLPTASGTDRTPTLICTITVDP